MRVEITYLLCVIHNFSCCFLCGPITQSLQFRQLHGRLSLVYCEAYLDQRENEENEA